MEKQKKRLILSGILTSLLAVSFMAPMGYAQEEEEDTFTLEAITVTAEKRESDLQKVPLSIQTVSGVELVTEAKQRIDEIMQGVVGVSSQGSQVGTDFYMRGLGTDAGGKPLGGVTQSAVAVLIDGVYQNRGEVVRGGTLDMAQAEVMRGTQSTTLGGSSLAGAVSLVSNDPVFEYEGSGSLGIGNYHLLSTQGVLNVPLADNQAARLAFSSERRDGYLSSNAGNSNLANYRLKYRWQPTETFNVVATFNHQDIGGNGVDNSVLTYAGHWEAYNANNAANYDAVMGDPPIYGHLDGKTYKDRDNPWDDGYPADSWPNSPYRDTKIDQYSAAIDWDLDIGTLSVTPSYQKAHFRSTEPPRSNSFRSENREQETTQLDIQLTSPADAPFEWLGGVYYYDTRFSGTELGTGLFGDAGGPGCQKLGEYSYGYCWASTDPNIQTTYSAYGNVSYPVMDTVRINAGLRYTKDEKSYKSAEGYTGSIDGPLTDFVYDNSGEADWDDITYRVGGEYDVNDQIMAYAMFATGYQPGNISFNEPTEAQTLDQWTLGVKSRLLQNRLQLNLEGFHSTYYNRSMQGGLAIYSDGWTGGDQCGSGAPGSDPFERNGNGDYCYSSTGPTVPELTSAGVDVEINFLITENDRFDFSVEYLQSEQGAPDIGVTESDLIGQGGATVETGFTADEAAELIAALKNQAAAYDGLTLQNSPEWSANASYSHVFELPNGSTLTPKVNVEYKDSYWSQGGGPGADIVQPGNSIQDSYSLWNAYLNWTSADDKFNINAYVKNIDDKPILTNLGQGGQGSTVEYVTLGAPRTFGVVLTVNL
jgi:iron complex outermembrane receptor protein